MYCAGHVGRAHTHRLTDMRAKKSFTEAFIKQHKDRPQVATVRCCCSGRNHSVVDALLMDSFGVLASTISLHACKLEKKQLNILGKCVSWENTMLVAYTHGKMAAVHFIPSLLVLVESAMKR